jgi:tetratricopeptide (TPR) repeat protein
MSDLLQPPTVSPDEAPLRSRPWVSSCGNIARTGRLIGGRCPIATGCSRLFSFRWNSGIVASFWLWMLLLALFRLDSTGFAAESGEVPESAPASQVVEFSGNVEVAVSGANTWKPAVLPQRLNSGDRVRTKQDSRAVLQLSDRSVVRIGPSTVVEIQPPKLAGALRRLRLLQGLLYFFNREKPSRMEFETPLASGAIRGTEFLLTSGGDGGGTELALLDGEVALQASGESLVLRSGERIVLREGFGPIRSAASSVRALAQWVLYYPAVTDTAALALSDEERRAWRPALEAYRQGDLPGAVASLPVGSRSETTSGTIFLATLKLASGSVQDASAMLAALSHDEATRALRDLMAAVTLDASASGAVPTNADQWLARSYWLQSVSRLDDALTAVREAVKRSPEWGLGWGRLAEMEFSFGRYAEAATALQRALTLSPRHSPSVALGGFIALERGRSAEALGHFDRAIQLDGSYGPAWLGRGLARAQGRDLERAAEDLQVASVLEPQRSLYRSALAKVWSELRDDALASKEFHMARELDPADPTPWFYESLLLHRQHRINGAVRALEESIRLNDGRQVFRSRLLLDQDRAVRRADLAAVYEDAGFSEVAHRSAARAVSEDPANFASHLYYARSLRSLEDPARFDLRYETPRQSELLLANLLAPRGGGNLSQFSSEQDMQRFFEPKSVSINSSTQYRSDGDWSETATLFGQLDGLSYALDGQYLSRNGQQPNGWLESTRVSLQVKQEVTASDSVYLQVSDRHRRSGDVARHWDPANANVGIHTAGSQEPGLIAGWHHEWAPGSHTLLLASRLVDRFELREPGTSMLFLRKNAAGVFDVRTDPFFDLNLDSDFTLHSIEVQHLWQTERHGLVVGGRFQSGEVETQSRLERQLSGVVSQETLDGDLQRADVYGLYHWRVWDPVLLSAGLAYHQIRFPRNADLPPLSLETDERSQVSPRAGLQVDLWKGALLRGGFSRSLGGLYFDDSMRLEPVVLAGFTQTYRSLAPESVVALVPGSEFQTIGVGLDQRLGDGTFFGVEAEELSSEGDRLMGAWTQRGVLPVPETPTEIQQSLEFRERTVSAYLGQLIGDRWSVGARYRWSEASLETRFPSISAGTPGLSTIEQDERSTLGDLGLFVRYYHESGLFGRWESRWRHQSNRGFVVARGGEDFWQHDLTIGYRFPHRRAEISASLLNLTDQDYQLSPLNYMMEPPRQRSLLLRLRFLF